MAEWWLTSRRDWLITPPPVIEFMIVFNVRFTFYIFYFIFKFSTLNTNTHSIFSSLNMQSNILKLLLHQSFISKFVIFAKNSAVQFCTYVVDAFYLIDKTINADQCICWSFNPTTDFVKTFYSEGHIVEVQHFNNLSAIIHMHLLCNEGENFWDAPFFCIFYCSLQRLCVWRCDW